MEASLFVAINFMPLESLNQFQFGARVNQKTKETTQSHTPPPPTPTPEGIESDRPLTIPQRLMAVSWAFSLAEMSAMLAPRAKCDVIDVFVHPAATPHNACHGKQKPNRHKRTQDASDTNDSVEAQNIQ